MKGLLLLTSTNIKRLPGIIARKRSEDWRTARTFTVYFTKDLVPVNKDFQYLNKNLPGLAMQYEAVHGKNDCNLYGFQYQFQPCPQAKFDLPKSGYRVMTYEESKRGGN